jgi:hypothetical protein
MTDLHYPDRCCARAWDGAWPCCCMRWCARCWCARACNACNVGAAAHRAYDDADKMEAAQSESLTQLGAMMQRQLEHGLTAIAASQHSAISALQSNFVPKADYVRAAMQQPNFVPKCTMSSAACSCSGRYTHTQLIIDCLVGWRMHMV